MSYSWMLSVPAWGNYHVGKFVNFVLPSVIKALRNSPGTSIRFVVHTDQPQVIAPYLEGFSCTMLPEPNREATIKGVSKSRYIKIGDADRTSLAHAKKGEVVGMLYGDTVVSKEFFSSAERRFDEGKKLVMMTGLRVADRPDIPIGASAEGLLHWAWCNPHAWIRNCTWGTQQCSKQPAVLCFERDGSVISRWFMLYSYAAIKDRNLEFEGLTIDHGRGLASRYKADEIYVATGNDEVGCASITPSEHDAGTGEPMTVDYVALWAQRTLLRRNLWMFQHRMRIIGDGDPGDREICDAIVAKINPYEMGRWRKVLGKWIRQ